MKRKISLILAICISFTMLTATYANALTKAKYEYVKIDKSEKYENGTFTNYYKYPSIKGKSNVAAKINSAFEKEGNNFVTIDTNYIDRTVEAYNTLRSYVTFNKKGILSVRFRTYWYVGGVTNFNIYGDTFSLKTGKKLSIYKVVNKKYAKYDALKKEIKRQLKKKTTTQIARDFDESYNTKTKLGKVEYYIGGKGNVYVCFKTYDLADGATGPINVVKIPSRYK